MNKNQPDIQIIKENGKIIEKWYSEKKFREERALFFFLGFGIGLLAMAGFFGSLGIKEISDALNSVLGAIEKALGVWLIGILVVVIIELIKTLKK